MALAAFTLLATLSAPVLGLIVAGLPTLSTRVRRLAYASVAAPSLYVFLGVVQALLGSPIPDPWVWCALWLAAMVFSFARPAHVHAATVANAGLGRWRVAHGISAVILLLYVLFHLGNHLAGLFGPAVHAAVMDVGRTVYRATLIEPILVAAFLFQAISGLYLAWRWSAARQDGYRTFQVASGVFLSVFILGHMNSVFIYARTYLGIPTDWAFATGAPTGLIHDPWNIRLVPHYALGVFFVLSHLVAGLRVVLGAHGARPGVMRFVWWSGMGGSGVIAALIIAAMCGVRM